MHPTISAEFAANTAAAYTLTIQAGTGGTITAGTSGSYAAGATVKDITTNSRQL
ncbi:MAG: hypothetical protein ABFD25_08490 [Clostridiaceae bacterium]